MSTPLDPTALLQKTTEITKHLRSRDVPLTSLLPFASAILDNLAGRKQEKNIYFPQKEDWLLEWLVQRLGEDDDGAREARCDPKFWDFLQRLLLLSISAGGILKKHNVLQLISKGLFEALLSQKIVSTAGLGVRGNDEDIGMEDEEIFSTPKEWLSSDSSISSPGGVLLSGRMLPKIYSLLASISGVLSCIQYNLGGGGMDRNVVSTLRGTPEIGAQILGLFLEACRVLVQEGLGLEEEWIGTVVNVWRSCIWGNPQLKKLSMIFSTSCLVPATHLLMTPSLTPGLRRRLEQLIAEFIFPGETIFPTGPGSIKPSSKNLRPLLEPLRAHKESLSTILRIAIISQTKRRKPDSTVVEVIFESITSAVLGVLFPIRDVNNIDSDIIVALLEVLIDTGTTVSSNTIAEFVDGISGLSLNNTSSCIRWDIVALALKLDFDIFLGKGNEERAFKLYNALTNDPADQELIYEVLELLIGSFVKARDLNGFVNIWISELRKDEARNGIWESDRVAKLFSNRMETSLLPGQTETIFKTAIQEKSWVVIDSLLRGLRREDTFNKIRPLLNKISEDVFDNDKTGWRAWRALVRGLQIDNRLAHSKQGKMLKILKKYAGQGAGDDARKVLFIGEALMYSSDDDGQAEVLGVFTKVMKDVTRSWDRSIRDIGPANLGVAFALGFVGRWMAVLERAQPDIRTGFVDEFLNMAIKNDFAQNKGDLTGRNIWQIMLARGISYEYPSLKDAIITALVAKLERPYEISQGIDTSLEYIEKGRSALISGDDMESYKFMVQSISKYPLEAIKRATRERVLDVLVLLNSSLKREGLCAPLRDEVKGLVARLWALGNASSFLARNVKGFMMWILEEGGQGEATRRILRCILSTKEQERSREFLTRLVELAESECLRSGKLTVGAMKACEIIIEEFWRSGEIKDVHQLREGTLRKLRCSIQAGEVGGHLIGTWRRIWVLDRSPSDKKEVLYFAQHIIERIKTNLPDILTVSELSLEGNLEDVIQTVAETVMLLCASSETTEETINTTALVVAMLDSPFVGCYRSEVILSYNEMVMTTLSPEVYLDCMGAVMEGCFSLDETAGSGYWDILKVLVNGAKLPEEENKSKIVIDYLSRVFSKLARSLPKTKTVAEFLAVTDCMDAILREKAWSVMQFNIDETLASVAITSSPSGPQFTPVLVIADEIFLKLCNILRLILSQHRRRVRGGRYHLVVTTLQSLLRCIFKRKTTAERKKSDMIVHPPWLLSNTMASQMPKITDKCADGFNRLLITFCEPSASSVRGKTRGKIDDNLVNSVRDREKREVASCVYGLLGEIVKGGLEGGIDGDIKVSISAIFEVLGTEGVKTFARTVDKEGRAMLRELRDEYNRVGGGTGEKF